MIEENLIFFDLTFKEIISKNQEGYVGKIRILNDLNREMIEKLKPNYIENNCENERNEYAEYIKSIENN